MDSYIELALKLKGHEKFKTVRIQTGKDFTPDARIMLAARLAHDCDMHVFKGLYVPASVDKITDAYDDPADAQYDDRYDAFYDTDTGNWIEAICDDPCCEYCLRRPAKHHDN